MKTTTCPRCGAPITLYGNQAQCEYCDYIMTEEAEYGTSAADDNSGRVPQRMSPRQYGYTENGGSRNSGNPADRYTYTDSDSRREPADKYAYTDTASRSESADKYAYTDTASRDESADKYAYSQAEPREMETVDAYGNPISPKSRTVALVLCLFLGVLGVHRFYAGRILSGILYLLTFGVFGIGILVDLILILLGKFKDSRKLPIISW